MQGRGENIQGVEAPQPVVTEEVIEVTETVEETPQNDAEPKEETARETTERAFRELEKQTKENAGDKDQAQTKPQAPEPKKSEPVALDEDSMPPNRLSVKEKEVFNRLPAELKPAFARMVREHEAKFTKTQQEAARIVEENRGIWEAVRPYATHFAERNLTTSQAIAGLLAAHEKLTNPQTALQKWIEIGADIGISEEQLRPFLQGNSAASVAPQRNPDVENLRQQIQTLESRLKQQDEQTFAASIAPIVAEGQAVANEMDSQGKYLYPELHDPEVVQSRVKPLVSALTEALPNLSYGDALKRAIHIMRGDSNGNFPRLNQTRLPAPNQTNTRAQQASVSVRGRASPPLNGSHTKPEIVPDSVRDTVKLALEQLRRGA